MRADIGARAHACLGATGAIQNLERLCGIVGPVAWGNLYERLSRGGVGHELYTLGALMCAAVVLLVPLARLGGGGGEKDHQ